MLSSSFECPITKFSDKKILLYIDQPIRDKWDIIFNSYQLGTLMCSPSQPNFENYKRNNLQSLIRATLRPLQGSTMEEIASIKDKLIDRTIWFYIRLTQPKNCIQLEHHCSKLKIIITIFDVMVTYCQSHEEKLNEKTLTTFNILEHYEINDIIFSNFLQCGEGVYLCKRST